MAHFSASKTCAFGTTRRTGGNPEHGNEYLGGVCSFGKDIIADTFFVAGSNDEGDFMSLTEGKIRQYNDRFQKPEAFTQEQLEDASAIFSLDFSK